MRPPGPVRHEPRAARTARGAFAALHERVGRRARAVRRRARTTRRAASRTPASRTGTSTPARGRTPSPRPAATAPSWPAPPGASALPAAWLGARRARVPFVLWSALWADLTTPAHVLARPLDAPRSTATPPRSSPTARTSRRSPARHGARRVEIAPQAVDNAFWSAPAAAPERPAPFTVLFVGRPAREKGVPELVAAWRAAALDPAEAALVLAGGGHEARSGLPGIQVAGALSPGNLRNFYAGASVVAIPSIPSRRFVEPWGLVANEAMNQHCAVIATDAVGAAAGGLVRQEATGLVVPAADSAALGAAIRRLHDDPALRARLAEAGARAVTAYTYEAWAPGFAAALAATATAGGLLA